MKKAIHAFLTVGFVLSIVLLALGVIYVLVASINVAINGGALDIAMLVWGIIFMLFGVANLIGMIKIRKAWPNVKSKAEAKKIAVWSIVLGALFTTFPIAAGILMLAMPEEQYGKQE